MRAFTVPLSLALLAACAPGPAAPLATDAAAPPRELLLSMSPMLPGQTATFTVSNLLPGQRVTVSASRVLSTAFCTPGPTQACLQLARPITLGAPTANRAGVATLTVTAPAQASGAYYFQAATARSGTTWASRTNLVQRLAGCGDGRFSVREQCDDGNVVDGDGCDSLCQIELPPDADVDGWDDSADNCPGTWNPDQVDHDDDGVGDVCDEAPANPNPGEVEPWNASIALQGCGANTAVSADNLLTVTLPCAGLEGSTLTVLRGALALDVVADGLIALDGVTVRVGDASPTPAPAPASIDLALSLQDDDVARMARNGTLALLPAFDADQNGVYESLGETTACPGDPCSSLTPIDADLDGAYDRVIVHAESSAPGAFLLGGQLWSGGWEEPGFADAAGPISRFTAPSTPGRPWILLGGSAPWLISTGGALVAVVASGVDYNHPQLPLGTKVINGHDYVGNDEDSIDTEGSGTTFASLIAALPSAAFSGMAPGSQLLSTRGMGGTITQMASAIQYAADQGARVISVNGGTDTNQAALANAVLYAEGAGAMVIGNAGSTPGNGTTPRYPGGYPTAFAVAATDATDQPTGTTRQGAWVDIAAPGTGIVGAGLQGATVTQSADYLATAFVAGAAAQLFTLHPDWTPADVRQRLISTARPIQTQLQIGAGRLDPFEALFNGDFRTGDLEEWATDGCAISEGAIGVQAATGPFALCRLGAGTTPFAVLDKAFHLGGPASHTLSFNVAFATADWGQWSGFGDTFSVELVGPSGTTLLGEWSTLGLAGAPVTGPDGAPWIATGWRPEAVIVPFEAGPSHLRFVLRHGGGDTWGDTAVMIDQVKIDG